MTENNFYLHLIKWVRSIIVIDNEKENVERHFELNGFPIRSGGASAQAKYGWTLGPVESEQRATDLAKTIASRYNFDIYINDELLMFPYSNIDKSTAASALGSIKTAKKSTASRANGKLGGRPKKS